MNNRLPTAIPHKMPVRFVVTGFSQFRGVTDNPTEKIVQDLDGYIQQRGGIKGGSSLVCTRVLQVGTKDVAEFLSTQGEALRECVGPVVWLHLGVSVLSKVFEIEQQAVNKASFSVPDEDGWQPENELIITGDALTPDSCIPSDLNVKGLVGCLQHQGFDVHLSDDAGAFVCNWTYCSSLHLCNCKGAGLWHSLFVHVPNFDAISQDIQMKFVANLMDHLSMCTDTELKNTNGHLEI